MANYVRRIVSGYKARFRDDQTGVDLGFPAAGIEGYYRNKREDVKKFLDTRHGDKYWVFNLCPMTENSYPASVFYGRVSRHPFPDHHAPPWQFLRSQPVKSETGKGRSGTIACSYLLTQESTLSAPKMERSYATKDWAVVRAQEILDAVEVEEEELDNQANASKPGAPMPAIVEDAATTSEPAPLSPASPSGPASPTSTTQVKYAGPSLQEVLDLHTSRRMRRPSSPGDKHRRGVSIPSQRRFLSYWSLVLADAAPHLFWPLTPPASLPEPSGGSHTLLEVAGVRPGRKKAGRDVQTDELWVSLARYKDDFVGTLESWERHTRDESGRMGKRRPGAENMQVGDQGEQTLQSHFSDGKWDDSKMIKIFSHLSTTDVQVSQPADAEPKSRELTYLLHPIPHSQWVNVRQKIKDQGKASTVANKPADISDLEVNQ
ncbi:phosphatases II, partial [Auriculariales sp. MPI-PUGE-AT-0066]